MKWAFRVAGLHKIQARAAGSRRAVFLFLQPVAACLRASPADGGLRCQRWFELPCLSGPAFGGLHTLVYVPPHMALWQACSNAGYA